MWKNKTPGIPDEEFERIDEVPITKEEIRVLQISKGRLCPGQTVYDIGCGSGSISVEASLQIESTGQVFAIDFDPKAVEITKKNLNGSLICIFLYSTGCFTNILFSMLMPCADNRPRFLSAFRVFIILRSVTENNE